MDALLVQIIVAAYLVMSTITLIAYGWDKRAAARGRWRLREMDLHLLALLGGFPGALIGQQLFRHKRHKRAFVIVTWLIVMLHIATWSALALRAVASS